MRNFILLSLVALLVWGCSGEVKSRSEQELLRNYLALHRKKDLDGIMSLFYQKDTPSYVLASVRRMSQENFKFTIISSEISEIPSEKRAMIMAGYPYDGKTLIPNLTPLKQIVLKYDTAGQSSQRQAAGSSIMFGREGEMYYLVLSKVKTE